MCTKQLSKTSAESRTKKNCKTYLIFRGITLNMMKHFFLCLRVYLDMFIDFIFSLYWDAKRQAIPDLDKKKGILLESATSLAEKIRNGKMKSENLVSAYIERIKTVNPIINAVTDERFQDAIIEAREIDNKIAAGLTDSDLKLKPYLGVPFTVKESHAVGGLLQTLGIQSRRYIKASEDAECVRLLKEAGAIVIAVTNVPEINKWQETRNLLFGQTNNPYHTGRTTGGSSGGEAALCASIATPIALCSDIGGSTRMPAFYCGLFGHNPTAGVTSLKGSVLRSGKDDTMAAVGFVSRNVEDLAPLTKIIASDKAHLLKLDREVNIKDLKFYYVETSKDVRCSLISQDLRKAMQGVITKLNDVATSTENSPKPYYHEGLNYMYSLWRYWMTKETENFSRMLTNNTGTAYGLLELVKKIFCMSPYTLAAIFKLIDDQVFPKVDADWAEQLTQEFKNDLLEKLGDNGVLIFPSAPQPAPYHYSCFLRPYNFAYWGILNVLRVPATQVPLGLNSDGLPLGIQVVSAPYNDALCLAVAKYLGKEFGGYVPPCKVLT